MVKFKQCLSTPSVAFALVYKGKIDAFLMLVTCHTSLLTLYSNRMEKDRLVLALLFMRAIISLLFLLLFVLCLGTKASVLV